MRSFVLHITNQDHTFCRHAPTHKETPDLDHLKHPDAINALKIFIEGYLDDREWFLHGFSTIQNESINSSICKRADKARHLTRMYAPLVDAGLLECNEGLCSSYVSWMTWFSSYLLCLQGGMCL